MNTYKQQMAELAVNLIRPELKIGYMCQPAFIPKLITYADKHWLRRH